MGNITTVFQLSPYKTGKLSPYGNPMAMVYNVGVYGLLDGHIVFMGFLFSQRSHHWGAREGDRRLHRRPREGPDGC